MRKRAIHQSARLAWQPPDTSRGHGDAIGPALTALGAVVYAVRTNDGLVKVGHTTDLLRRAHQVGSGMKAILGWRPGTRQDEAEAHARLRDSLARGRETYSPTPQVLQFVNQMRADLGVLPIDSI